MHAYLGDLYRRRELLGILIARNIRIRYKNSALGFFWTLLAPLFMIVIYSVFARIMRWHLGRENFLPFLVVGIVIWQFLVMCLNDSLAAIAGNANLIKKTAFPRHILPASTVLANGVNFLLTFFVLLLFLRISGSEFRALWLLPLVMASQCALCLGLALAVSAGNVFFRDTEHAVGVGTLAWFFMSPVFYAVDLQIAMMPPALSGLVYLNPMSGLISAYRYSLMSEPVAAAGSIWISFAVSWVVLAAGYAVFGAAENKFADEL